MPNESFIHADIFFFISTIAVVLVSIGAIVALFYVIRILRDVREVSDKVKEESGEIMGDLKKLRANLRDEGVKWKHVVGLARTFFVRKGTKAKRVVDRVADKAERAAEIITQSK